MKVTILGAGAYGLALADTLAYNKNNVNIWTNVKKEYEMLLSRNNDENIFSDFRINDKIVPYDNIKDALSGAEIIFVVVSSKYIMNVLQEIKKYYNKKQIICIATKGILQERLFFMSRIFSKALNTKKVAVLSGGTFAKDMFLHDPMGLMIGTCNKSSGIDIKRCLKNEYLDVIVSRDIIGIEICGAFKNIMAISLGIIQGNKYNESTKCMFVAKVVNELSQMISLLGGEKNTILSYAGIGDLWLTGTSTTSRNYTFGLMIGEKCSREKINQYINTTTIEGLDSLNAIYKMLKIKNYNSKFISCLYNIIYNDESLELLKEYLRNN